MAELKLTASELQLRSYLTGELAPGGFLESAVSAASRELIGLPPTAGAERFRRDNFLPGMLSQFAGLAVPYGGWATVTRMPAFAGRIARIGATSAAAHPMRAAIVREGARWLPFEAGRLAGATALGGDKSDVLASAGLDLALFGGFSGVGAAFRGAAPRLPVSTSTLGAASENLLDPAQIRMRQLHNALVGKKVPDAAVPDVRRHLEKLSLEVRTEQPLQRIGYVRDLEGGLDKRPLARAFTLRQQQGKTLSKMRFHASSASFDFASKADWQAAAKVVGLPDGFERYGQYFRLLRAKKKEGEKVIKQTFRGMQPVGSGWYIAKENSDGLYVMGRNLNNKAAVLFKTDSPGYFAPAARKQWADLVTARSGYLGGGPKKVGAQLYDSLVDFTEQIPMRNYLDDLARRGKPREYAKRTLEKLGLDPKKMANSQLAGQLSKFGNLYLAPAAHQFRRVPRFSYLQKAAKYVHDKAAARAELYLFGRPQSANGSLWYDLAFGGELKGGIIPQLKDLGEQELLELWQATMSKASLRRAKNFMGPKAFKVFKLMDDADRVLAAETIATQKAAGTKEIFEPLTAHLGVGRTWRGDFRARVFDDQGRFVFMGSGYNGAQAAKEADDIIAAAKKSGEGWTRSEVFLSGRDADIGLSQSINTKVPGFRRALVWQRARAPGFFKPRVRGVGIGGFVGEKAPWTKDELVDIVTQHTQQQYRYLANLSVHDILRGPMDALLAENPTAWKALTARMDDLAGVQGPWARSINKAVDELTPLANVLGKNSASRLVSAANGAMFHMTQGMGQIAFNVINAMTFLQTGLAQSSYVLTGAARNRGYAYTWWPTSGKDGLARGAMGVLDPVKFAWRGVKLMGHPDAQTRKLFLRAANEGVTDPRFAEEWVGQTSNQIKNWKEALTDGGMVRWMGDVSKWMPATTEKFARGHAFANAILLGRDFLHLTDEEAIYRFAKEFTENSMFLYSVADRPRLITGPIGGAFGLWKNWQMNYMAWWQEYLGEAFLRGNFAPLLWSVGGTFASAGVGGLPLYGAANAMSKWVTDKSVLEHTYNTFHDVLGDNVFADRAADTMWMGLPGFFGVSLQTAGSGPFADPARDASMLMTFPYVNRMKAIGQLFGDGIDHFYATGENPIKGERVRDQFYRAFMPKTIYRLMSVVEGNAIKSLATGHPRQKDVGLFSRGLYTLGFSTADVEKHNAVADILWSDNNKKAAHVQALGKAYFEAVEAKDWREADDILKRAVAQEIVGNVINSYKARLSRSQDDLIEAQGDPGEVIRRFKNVIGR